jgi:hypothetical protein
MANKHLSGLFLGLLLVGCVAGVLIPAGLGWDFANFYDAGRRISAGQVDELYEPTNPIAGQPPQGTLGFYGTPISALLYIPMARLSPGAALIAFKIENVVALFAAFALLFTFSRVFLPAESHARDTFAALFTGLCLIFQPFWTVFRVGGQTTPTVFLLLALAMIFHTDARRWATAICLVAAALIKPALAPMLLFLALASGRGFIWRLALVGIGSALFSIVMLGWPVHAAFLQLLRDAGQHTWAWPYNSSIFILLDNVRAWLGPDAGRGPYASFFTGLTLALQATILVGVVFAAVRARRQGWSGFALRHFDFMLAILLFLLWSRTLWEHYLAVLFLPLLYVVVMRRHFSPPAIRIVVAIVVLCVFQNLVFTNWLRATLPFDSLPALVAVGVFKSAPLLLTVAFVVRHGREIFASYAAWPQDLSRASARHS